MAHDRHKTPEARIGRRTRALREMNGWSQAELAEQLKVYGVDVHQTTIAKLEGGSRPIRVNEQHAIASLFKVSPADLVAAEESPATQELDAALIQARRAEVRLATAEEGLATMKDDLEAKRLQVLRLSEEVEGFRRSKDEAAQRYIALLAAHDEGIDGDVT